MFEQPPFISCPSCGKPSFGVLMIPGRHYVRRCQECRHAVSFPLPELTKKVIYLDQMAISNMMLALNPDTRAYQAGRVDPRWGELFRHLDHLVKAHLIVCPESLFHQDESMVSPFYAPLKRMYEHLSGETSFHDTSYIEQSQLDRHVRLWVAGRSEEPIRIAVEDVVEGRLHEWLDHFRVGVNLSTPQEWIDDLRQHRESVHEEISKIAEQWRAEGDVSFQDRFIEEVHGYGWGLIEAYRLHLERVARVVAGVEPPSLAALLPPLPVRTVHIIRDALREAGVANLDLGRRTREYLLSDALQYLPVARIRALLFTAIARKVSSGQQRPPNRGTVSDITMVSVLLPYCDAMLLDNEIAGYLREQPLAREVVAFRTQIFSLNTMSEMMEYLNGIEVAASADHLHLLQEIYGPAWGDPYEGLYIDRPT